MASSCSDSDLSQSSPELVRKLQRELRMRSNNDGQAVASTSQPSLCFLDTLKNAYVSAKRQTNNKRNRDEVVQVPAASGTSSGSSHSLCSPQSPAVQKGKNALIVAIKEEGLSDDQQKGSPMATSSDGQHPDKSGQDEPPTSASHQDTPAGGGGAAASPSVGTATPSAKPKRKRIRKSKKAPTFTVDADVAHFKEKVQELTGQRAPPIQLETLQNRELCVQVQVVRPEPQRHCAAPLQAMEVDAKEISMHFSSNLVEGPSIPSSQDGMEQALTFDPAFDQEIELRTAVPLEGTTLTGDILDYTMGYSSMYPSFLEEFMDQEQLEPDHLFSEDCGNNDFPFSFSMDVKPPPPSGEQSSSEEEMVVSFFNN